MFLFCHINMSKKHCYSVYIMTNFSKRSLYTGVTNDLRYRVFEHKTMQGSTYTSKYKCFYLIYYEDYQYINEAIDREKQFKRWRRSKKVDLINIENKKWEDIADEWYEDEEIEEVRFENMKKKHLAKKQQF